jgi:hypothetical protein
MIDMLLNILKVYLVTSGVALLVGMGVLLNATFLIYGVEPWRLGISLQSLNLPLYVGRGKSK